MDFSIAPYVSEQHIRERVAYETEVARVLDRWQRGGSAPHFMTLSAFAFGGTGSANLRVEPTNSAPNKAAPHARISPAQRTIGRLREFAAWGENWDGEGAPAPDLDAIDSAAILVGFLANHQVKVTVALDAFGKPMLILKGEFGEGEITVIGSDRLEFAWFGVFDDAAVDEPFNRSSLPGRIIAALEPPVVRAA